MTSAEQPDPTTVVIRFNDSVNGRDLDGLARLMTDDHTFIDTEASVISGTQAVLDAWRRFFESFPDYRNVFDSFTVRGDVVAVTGHSVCADPSLAGPARWTARISEGKVAEWRIHTDGRQTREG